MTDWLFDVDAVITETDSERWWHVLNRFKDVDQGERYYRLADATHTEYKEKMYADRVESEFESAGWKTSTKPAAERGFRVNGVLCGPSDVDHWKGNDCLHERSCPDCGADGMGEIDIIQDHAEERLYCECRECGEEWDDSDE